ncbi:MAG: hypothetical protein WCT42_00205 [Candidatus Paceibacterota bacterium]
MKKDWAVYCPSCFWTGLYAKSIPVTDEELIKMGYHQGDLFHGHRDGNRCPNCGGRDLSYLTIIFGAPDIEEQKARQIADEYRIQTATATMGGVICNPMTAYKADGFIMDPGQVRYEKTTCILFECAPTAAQGLKVVARCDHHNPGDAGFGKPAGEFFEASSLGQLLNFLGIEATQEDRVIAAADHCLSAAYAGLCPGVTAEEVLVMRLPELMKRENVSSESDAMKGIEEALHILNNPPATVLLGGKRVADIRELGNIPFTIEAGVMTGTPYMAKGDKRFPDKVNLSGTKEVVADFLGEVFMVEGRPTYPNGWASQNGLHQPYGDANRGFAGAYDKPQS